MHAAICRADTATVQPEDIAYVSDSLQIRIYDPPGIGATAVKQVGRIRALAAARDDALPFFGTSIGRTTDHEMRDYFARCRLILRRLPALERLIAVAICTCCRRRRRRRPLGTAW
jgi:hypothetical protein